MSRNDFTNNRKPKVHSICSSLNPFAGGTRMSADEEIAVATRIQSCEKQVGDALLTHPVAQRILVRSPKRKERTRAGSVNRLERALNAVASDPQVDSPSLRALLHEAASLRWGLAESVQHVAYGEARKLARVQYSAEDLAQDGMIGIYKAALRFDPGRGVRFTTYARWWARAEMMRAIEQKGRYIRLPGGVAAALRDMERMRKQWSATGDSPTVGDFAERLDLTAPRVELILNLPHVVGYNDVNPEDDSPDFGGACDATQEDAVVLSTIWQDCIAPALQGLGERERYILEQRYLHDERTMADIGESLGLSRERVRQLEQQALAYLRAYMDGDSTL